MDRNLRILSTDNVWRQSSQIVLATKSAWGQIKSIDMTNCKLRQNYKVLWRYSLIEAAWRSKTTTSVDFSTMIMGYALKYLPEKFYDTFAANNE